MKTESFYTMDELAAAKYSSKIADDLRSLRLALQASTEFSEHLQKELNKAREPDHFWCAEDPEDSGRFSPQDMAEYFADYLNGDDVFRVMCHKVLPDREMRVWVEEVNDEQYTKWEWVK